MVALARRKLLGGERQAVFQCPFTESELLSRNSGRAQAQHVVVFTIESSEQQATAA
jgi:hypothetical protein